ncbi:MAG TPA: PQQ-binding-like beta-propeller repeat protein [Streptosporangiaceae bacterium]
MRITAALAAAGILAAALASPSATALAASRATARPAAAHSATGHPAAASGSQLWLSRFIGQRHASNCNPLRALASPDSSTVYVVINCGRDSNGFGPEIGVVAYNASTGAKVWKSYYPPFGQRPRGAVTGTSAVLSPDGTRLYITGSFGHHEGRKFQTLAYDTATGALAWQQRYQGGPDQLRGAGSGADSIAVSPDGSMVFVTGYGSAVETNLYAALTFGYDAATGATVWMRRSVTPLPGFTASVAVSPDGTTVLVSNGTTKHQLTALDATTGATMWTRYDTATRSAALPVTVSADGSTVVTADLGSTAAYAAATGARLWIRRYAKSDRLAHFTPSSLAVSPDGSVVYASGTNRRGRNHPAATTVAYDIATGATRWVATYYAGGTQEVAITPNPDGSALYVAAESETATTATFVLLAFDSASGAALWTRMRPAQDTFPADPGTVAVSPDGSTVFAPYTEVNQATKKGGAVTVAYRA